MVRGSSGPVLDRQLRPFHVGIAAALRKQLLASCGLASVPLAVWLLRGFRRDIALLSLRRAWHMAWLLFLCAAMITTAAQYIYFAYLDGGLLARAYSELLTSPEYRPLLQQMLPGQDIDALATDMTDMLAQTTPSQLTMQLAFMNVLLATILAIPTALFSFKSEK